MLKPSIVRELRKIVGSDHVLTAPEELVAYSYDATRIESLPWVVVRPETAREISDIVLLANRELFPIVARGAGSGMSGGSVPICGGMALSLERMNRILEIDENDLIAVVEPGVITGFLQQEVEARGLFYPPDPASRDFCTIGGNIAECAGGLRAVKYGVTRDYVLGLEVVLPTGEIIRTGAMTMKSVAGYDLTRLIVGSEGTLGIVTKATLRLLPLPEDVMTISAFFETVNQAASACQKIIASRIIPRAMEFMDSVALRAVEQYLHQNISGGAGAMILVELDGPACAIEKEARRSVTILEEAGALRIETASDYEGRERLWKARRAISPALYAIKPRKINEDIVVPRGRLSDILYELSAIASRHGLLIANFGHAGDGNIHTNIMIDEDETVKAEAAVKEIFQAVIGMNGSISGEHGIGLTKAAYLPMETGSNAILTMKKIKKALDPNNIMNPGKIFLDGDTK